jgi:hypothetical protein
MAVVRFATAEPAMEKLSFNYGRWVHALFFTRRSRISLDL